MNVLAKVKSDERVVEVKEAVDGGEALGRAEAKVASGLQKPGHPREDGTTLSVLTGHGRGGSPVVAHPACRAPPAQPLLRFRRPASKTRRSA